MSIINRTIFPRIMAGSKVFIAGKYYTADFWHTPDSKGYYEFIGDGGKSFKRTQEQVAEAIKDNKIRRL